VCLDGNTVTLKHDTRYNTNTRKRIKKHVNSRYPGRSMVTTVVDHLLVFKTDIPVSDISIVDREARIMRATCELRASIEKLTTGTISRRSKEKPPHPYNTKTGRRRLTPAF
jgi:hypothetical protein